MVIYLGMEMLTWYIDMNGIENTNILKYPYPIDIKKRWYQTNTGPYQSFLRVSILFFETTTP